MKPFKLIFLFFISLFFVFSVFAEETEISIIDINSKQSNKLKIFFDKDIQTNTNDIKSDIKVFRYLKTSKISLDLENDKLVHLALDKQLEKNTSYSLLSVYWAEWSIDFNTEAINISTEIDWSSSDWIEKLVISDSKNIEIYFKKSIKSESVDIKLLREHNNNWLEINLENKKQVDVLLKDQLLDNSKYIVMMFSISLEWDFSYAVSNSIYDFKTESLSSIDTESINIENKKPIEDIWEETWEVALNSAEVPKTWAETWILILVWLLLWSFIYFRKKFFKN